MRSNSMANVLFTKTQQRVLGLIYGRPEQSFYLNQVVSLAKIGKGTVNRELERLAAAGLVVKRKVGNQNHYQANPECPIFQELLSIVRKTLGVADVIRIAVGSILDDIVLAFIYGSIAKAEDTGKSDVDLFVVTDKLAYSEVMELLFEAEQQLGRAINPTLYGIDELKGKAQQKNAFVIRVLAQPKIWIKEDEDVYRVIGESGKDPET